MKVQVIFHFGKQLECGPCDPILIEVDDASLLSANIGQLDPDKLTTFITGEIESFTLVADSTGCNALYQYTLSYDDSQLVDPAVTLDECNILRVCCAGCTIKYVDQQFIDESTVSSLLDNGDGTFTHDDGLGNLTIFNARSSVTDNGDGTFTHTDETGLITPFSALGALVDNGDNSFTYTDQTGAATLVPFGHTFTQPVPNLLRLTRPDATFDEVTIVHPPAAAETVTTLVDNGDVSFTYTSEDATVTNFNAAHVLSEPVVGTIRLTRPDATFDDIVIVPAATVNTTLPIQGDGSGGSPVDLLLSADAGNIAVLGTDTGVYVPTPPAATPETVTTLVDNANDTFTYTSEDATVTIFDAQHDLSQPVPDTIRLTRPGGSFQEVTITHPTPPAETVTTLVDNANNTFTYTSEDATVTVFDAEHDLSQPVAGTIRLTRPDATFQEVTITHPAETITTLVDNANDTFTYTSEDATVTIFDAQHDLSQPVADTIRLTRPGGSFQEVTITHPAETITTLVDNANDTFTYTSEDATVTIFDAQHDLSQPVADTIRLTRPGGSFQEVTITHPAETVTTLVDNTNNTFTYTSENATVTNFNAAHTLSEPVPNTIRLTRPDGSADDVVVSFAETVTTLVNNGNNTFTYTNEAAAGSIFDVTHTLSAPATNTLRLTKPNATFDTINPTVFVDAPLIGSGLVGSPIDLKISTDAGNTLVIGTDSGLHNPPTVAAPGSNIDRSQNTVLVTTSLAAFTTHTTTGFTVPGPVNTYKFTGSYVVRMDATNREYQVRIQIDGVTQDHVIEERRGHTAASARITKVIIFTVSSIAAGARSATLQFAVPSGGTLDIFRSYLEVERLV